MPYKKDPRGRVTLNLQPDEFEELTAAAKRAAYKTAGRYALALVRARGEAPRPVVDENGQQRVAFLKGKLGILRDALDDSEARCAALAARLRAAERELDQRPSFAQIEEEIKKALDAHRQKEEDAKAKESTPAAAALSAEDSAEARRRRLRLRR